MTFHQVTAVALFVVLHVIIITSNGKVNNKQQAATKRLMQKEESKWKKKKDGRWTKYSYQNRSRNKPAGSKSTLESMMSCSAVVAAVRSVGSTSILASQAATEAEHDKAELGERQRTATNWHWKGCRTKQNTMVIYTPNGARIPGNWSTNARKSSIQWGLNLAK